MNGEKQEAWENGLSSKHSMETAIPRTRALALRISPIIQYPTPHYVEVYDLIRSAVFREEYLQTPQVEVATRDSRVLARYNLAAGDLIFHRLRAINPARGVGTEVVPGVSLRDLIWITEVQVKIAQFICERELAYVCSGNVSFSAPLSLRAISEHLRISYSGTSLLYGDLALRLPNGDVRFSRDLLSQANSRSRRILTCLTVLARRSEYFANGKWKVRDAELVGLLEAEFTITLSRRTINTYRNKLTRCLTADDVNTRAE